MKEKEERDGWSELKKKYELKQRGTGSPLEKPVDENAARYEAKRKGSSFAQKGQASSDANNLQHSRKEKLKYRGQEDR